MLKDAVKNKEVSGIPRSLMSDWSYYTSGISEIERCEIISWIGSKFDEVANRKDKIQPSSWLGSDFDWL